MRGWVFIALGAALWARAAWAQGGAAAAEKPVLAARVAYDIVGRDIRVQMEGAAVFQTGGLLRVAGKARMPELTGDERKLVDLTLVSDGNWLRQLIVLDGLPNALVYDLGRVKAEFPDVSLGRDLDPRRYAELLRREGVSRKTLGEERVGDARTQVHELLLAGEFRFSPAPGSYREPPQPRRLKLWMAEDGLPRRVEAYDEGEKRFLTLEFADVAAADQAQEGAFKWSPPADTLELDATDLALETLRSRSKSGLDQKPGEPVAR